MKEENKTEREVSSSFGDRDRKAFSELLGLAEKVQSEKDMLQRQMYLSLGAIAFTMISGFSVFATYIGFRSFDGSFSISEYISEPAGVLSVIILGAGYLAFNFIFLNYMRRMRRERRAFEEVMHLVHEVFESAREEMSPLEIAEVKIRLSRLDL